MHENKETHKVNLVNIPPLGLNSKDIRFTES